jgi:hypothetical protein
MSRDGLKYEVGSVVHVSDRTGTRRQGRSSPRSTAFVECVGRGSVPRATSTRLPLVTALRMAVGRSNSSRMPLGNIVND